MALKYDIFKDNLLLQKSDGFILLLDQEMIDTFSLVYNDDILRFAKFNDTIDNMPEGSVNILYDSFQETRNWFSAGNLMSQIQLMPQFCSLMI